MSATYNTAIYHEPGGSKQIVSSGGEIEVQSGATLDVQSGATATINTATITTLNSTNIDAGASGTAGSVDIFPTTASKGKLTISAVDNTGDTAVTIKNAEHGQATNVHIPDSGLTDAYLVQSTAALTVAEVDVLDGADSAQVVASKAVVADANGKINLFRIGSAAASASGLLMGVGTTANPATTSDADKKFIEIRTKSTATSGDSRNIWLRHDIGGAAGSGECLRAITDLTAAAATARGAQISLQPDDTGYVTGLGVGVDAQLLFGNAALAAGGTYAALNAEVYSAGSSTDVSGCTKLSFMRFVNGGDATGAATVDGKAFLMELSGFTPGANVTDTISSTSLTELPAGTIGLAIDVGGTRYYIPAVVSTEWN